MKPEAAVVPLIKSVRKDRIAENLNVHDFVLDGADMAAIDALDCLMHV